MNVEIDLQNFLRVIKVVYPIYWIPKWGTRWYNTYMSRLVYHVDDTWIVQEQGVFFFRKKRIRRNAIREAAIYRGPLLQCFGASIVHLYTTGQQQGFPVISFLCPADPEALVERIMRPVPVEEDRRRSR